MAWYNDNFIIRRLFGGTFYSRSYNRMLGRKTPIWIDTNNLAKIYETIPEVRLVIDYKAAMFSAMKIKVLNQNDEEQPDHPALKLLAKPNPLQSQNEYLSQYMINKSIFANAFINKIQATSVSFPAASYILPSGEMKIVPTGKIFKQTDINEIIDHYELHYSGKSENYQPEEILHKNDVASVNYMASESRLIPLKMPISNIEGAYKTRNILIHEKGAIGILTNQGKDAQGAIPVNDKERKRIQEGYKDTYGIQDGQDRLIISNADLKWQPMAYPVKDLMVFEEVQEDFNKIVDAFGLNLNIFSQTKGSTFENVVQGLKGTYQNTIIPEANDLMQGLTEFFKLSDQGMRLVADYSHLPVMQEDELNKALTLKAKTESIDRLLALGLIDQATAETMIA